MIPFQIWGSDIFIGFNKYYPPDYDGDKHGSLNSYRGIFHSSCTAVSESGRFPFLQASMLLVTGRVRSTKVSSLQDLSFHSISGGKPLGWYLVTIIPQISFKVEPVIITSEWVFDTMRRNAKSAIIIPLRSMPSAANAICVTAGLRLRLTRRYVIQVIFN